MNTQTQSKQVVHNDSIRVINKINAVKKQASFSIDAASLIAQCMKTVK